MNAAGCMLISAVGFSGMGLCVKLAGLRGFPVMEMIAARAAVSLLLSYGDIRRLGLSPLGNKKALLLLRSILGLLALIAFYTSLTQLPLAEATLIHYLNPVFTALFAWLFLDERIQWRTAVCMLLGLGGVVCIAQPQALGGAALPLEAIAIGLFGAAGSGAAYTLIRYLSQSEHPAVIVLYFPLVCLPVTLVLGWQDFILPIGSDWLLLLAIGVFTQIGQIGLTRGVALESAAKATALSYVQVVFAAILGIAVLGESPAIATLIGAALILSGALINQGSPRQKRPDVTKVSADESN